MHTTSKTKHFLKTLEDKPEFSGCRPVEVRTRGAGKITPLHVAAREADAVVVRAVLVAGGYLDSCEQDDRGYTPLHEAIEHGNTEAARVLIGTGVLLLPRTNEGESAVQMAERLDRVEVQALLRRRLEARDDYIRIMELIVSGDIAVLEKLSRDEPGFPAGKDAWFDHHWIHHAIESGSLEVVRWMIANNAPLRFCDNTGYTALHSALGRPCSENHAMLRLLIKAGADVNARGVHGYTPAHMAAVHNDLDALRILHEAGADFSIRTNVDHYTTPLEEAREMGAAPEAITFLEAVCPG